MKLSVVVGTLNRRDRLRACIESIFGETTVPVRVYVEDAGSVDGTIEYLKEVASDKLIPIFAGRRTGQARAYNAMFALAETPYVCWLSDDNVVVNRGLDVAVQILDGDDRIGMVALKVKDRVGPFRAAPYIGGISAAGILNVNQGMLRRHILSGVGGFSEEFRDYGIDPDLTARVLFAGHAVVYTKVIAIHHYRDWPSDPSSPEYGRHMERQEKYLDLYRRKFEAVSRQGLGWSARRTAWRAVKALFRVTVDSAWGPVVVRDWYNAFAARYISPLDAWHSRGRPYHLLQVCREAERPDTRTLTRL